MMPLPVCYDANDDNKGWESNSQSSPIDLPLDELVELLP